MKKKESRRIHHIYVLYSGSQQAGKPGKGKLPGFPAEISCWKATPVTNTTSSLLYIQYYGKRSAQV